jgi:hypothetical protein
MLDASKAQINPLIPLMSPLSLIDMYPTDCDFYQQCETIGDLVANVVLQELVVLKCQHLPLLAPVSPLPQLWHAEWIVTSMNFNVLDTV